MKKARKSPDELATDRENFEQADPPSDAEQARHGDSSQVLLNCLLRDPAFLREALSENKMAERLGLKLSTLREVVIAFVSSDWLIRTHRGVSRLNLKAWDLVQLFGTRLAIERCAIQKAVKDDDEVRIRVDGSLLPIVNRQREICSSEIADDHVEWFSQSVDFHVTLVKAVGFAHLARTLERIFWQIRIGAGFALEDNITRAKATELHGQLVRGIQGLETLDEDFYIIDHIKRPLKSAMAQIGAPTDDRSIERYWNSVEQIAAGVYGKQKPQS